MLDFLLKTDISENQKSLAAGQCRHTRGEVFYKLKIKLLNDRDSCCWNKRKNHANIAERKNDQQDNLLEELLREKAAVLSRAGMAVDDAIERLMSIDREIEVKISLLNTFCWNNHASEMLQKKQMVCEEINLSIDQFNAIRQKPNCNIII